MSVVPFIAATKSFCPTATDHLWLTLYGDESTKHGYRRLDGDKHVNKKWRLDCSAGAVSRVGST